jgi:GNAT superfamily N-acetyltransferase
MSAPFLRAAGLAMARGARALWFTTLAKLCYRRVEIREEVLLGKSDDDYVNPTGCSISQLTAADLDEYTTFRRPSNPDSGMRRMHDGHVCFVARHEGKIICTTWGAGSNAKSWYLSTEIPLTPDEAYAYDLFTAPEWRRKGIGTAVLNALHNYYRVRGKRRVLSMIVPENHASISGRLGSVPIGRMGFVGIGKLRYDFCHMKAGKLAPGQLPRTDAQRR